MKRNETVLVYAVTGLLLVILLVAVVFGDQNPANASKQGSQGPDVTELAGFTPARREGSQESGDETGDKIPDLGTSEEGPVAGPEGSGAGTASPTGPQTPVDPLEAGGDAGTAGTGSETEGVGPAVGPAVGDLARPAVPAGTGSGQPVSLSATVDSMEQKLEATLGSSRRSGPYRVVQSRRGDTLRGLVIRWCGDAENMQMVEILNENIVDGNLSYGQEVMVPWVDASALLAAYQTRKVEVARVEAAKGEFYTLQKGDSLWNLAKARVAKNKIPAWLTEFQKLNPEITDPSVLIAGQKVRLPPVQR